MEQIDQALNCFIAKIKESAIYKEYEIQKDKVSQFPDLKAKIDEYRRQNFMLQNNASGEELFHKIEEFDREYEKFREDPLVADFLAAELSVCRMMQHINMAMIEELDFE